MTWMTMMFWWKALVQNSPACFITLEIPTVTQLGPTYLPHDDDDDDEDDDGGDDDDDDWVLGVREGCKEEKT